MRANTDRCTGCRVCEMICSVIHSGKINTQRARIRVTSLWPDEETIHVCRSCEDPPCVEVCPEGALRWKDNGVPVLVEEECIQCRKCIAACPFGAIFWGKEETILICDTCNGDYECVQWCPNQVLSEEEVI